MRRYVRILAPFFMFLGASAFVGLRLAPEYAPWALGAAVVLGGGIGFHRWRQLRRSERHTRPGGPPRPHRAPPVSELSLAPHRPPEPPVDRTDSH